MEHVLTPTKHSFTVLYDKYENTDLNKLFKKQCHNLTEDLLNKLLKLLKKNEELFDRELGTWKTDPIYFELKDNVKPICLITCPVPKIHKEIHKKEVKRLVLLGLIENSNKSEWGAPYFAPSKPKTNQVHFLSNFRNLNNKLNWKPYPMPKSNEILLK